MKFVSLSQLLGFPFFGSSSCLFTVPGFILTFRDLKKKEEEKKTEGRSDIKGKKEGIEQERRRGRRC